MKQIRWIVITLLILTGVLGYSQIPAYSQKPLAQADQHFKDHNYKEALESYKKTLVMGLQERPDYVKLQILKIQLKLKAYDDFIKDFNTFLPQLSPNIWKARMLHLAAKSYQKMPHYGYKRNDKIYRDKSHREGQYVYLYSQDRKLSKTYYLLAHALYKQLAQKSHYKEIIAFDSDLFAFINQRFYHYGEDWKSLKASPAQFKGLIDNFDFNWPEERQIYTLYREMKGMAEALKDQNLIVPIEFSFINWQFDRIGRDHDNYPLGDPLDQLVRVLRRYPNAKIAPNLQLTRGMIHKSRSQFVEALKHFDTLIKRYPSHKLVNNARAQIQDIKWPKLGVTVPGIQASQDISSFSLRGRNLEQVNLKVYSIDLKKRLTDYWILYDAKIRFNQFTKIFDKNVKGLQKFYGKKLLDWQFKPDVKPYHQFSKKLQLAKTLPAGAYVIEATGKDTEAAALLLISDITISSNQDRDKTVFFVTNADSGQPIPNAELFIKEHYYSNGYQVKVHKTKTDKDGIYSYKTQAKERSSSEVEAFVVKDSQQSMTRMNYWSRYSSKEKYFRAYIQTDRPVYRPGQTISFRNILRFYDNGSYQTETNRPIEIKVKNPKGETIYEKVHKTDRFGLAYDKFQLSEEPPLGVYYFEFKVPGGKHSISYSSGKRFRVEEYKRPEFKIDVQAVGDTPKPGENAKVKIKANYYFGAPVVDGKLKYTIYKRPFYMPYMGRPSPYSWLYGNYNAELYRRPYRGRGNVIKQETIELKGKPHPEITFATDKSNTDYVYNIQVELTDASRRTIRGEGSVKITNQSFYAFVHLEKGFYAPGQNLDIEVNLRTPNRQPVKQQSGQLNFYKLSYQKDKKEADKTLIKTIAVTSDQNGRIFHRWVPDQEGQFKIVYEAKDKFEREVKNSRETWIVSQNFQGGYYRFNGVEVLSDRRLYKEGDTARLMISSQYPDSHILLFEEGGKEILSHRLIRLNKQSKVLHWPIRGHHIPNFNLKAIMIHQRKLHSDVRELFVPPVKQMLNLSIKPRKKVYRPGEEGHIQVQVKDHNGWPVQTAIGLGIVDSSIYYIQNDNSGDIRKFYFGDRRSVNRYVQSSFGVNFSSMGKILKTKERFKTYGYRARLGQFADRFNGSSGAGERRESSDEEVDDGILTEPNAPAPTPAQVAKPSPKKVSSLKKEDKPQEAGGDGGSEEVKTRSDFRETAYWSPIAITNWLGSANVKFKFPDSLTTWRITAKGISPDTQVGQARAEVITTKKLLLRMQAPRFFTERDELILSANIHNEFNESKTIRAELKVDGAPMSILDTPTRSVQVPAHGEKRVDWKVKVLGEGQAKITMKALSSGESDAVQMRFPVYVHGIDKTLTKNGVLKEESQVKQVLQLPAQRKVGAGNLKLKLQPSLAGTLLDALPYLAQYPYGCVEQTTSRFVPAILTAHTLQQQGISLADLGKQQNLNKQLVVRKHNPVWNKTELDKMVKTGLKRLYSFQNSDGGFGWWSGSSSDPYMSAYVLYALQIAKSTDYKVKSHVIDRGLRFLKSKFNDMNSGNLHLKTYLSFVLSMDKRLEPKSLDKLYNQRDELNHYSKALLALTYHYLGVSSKAQLIMQNLKSYVLDDTSNGTASWPGEQRYWWYWYGDRVETNAFILKAFVNISPQDPIIPRLVRWLVNNRQGNRWHSTKDTAQVIYAINDYILKNNELSPDYQLNVKLNGKVVKNIQVNAKNVLTFDNQVLVNDKDLLNGANTLEISKTGKGVLYYSTALSYFTKEENIKGAGNEVFVKREYYRVTSTFDASQQKMIDTKTLIQRGDVLTSGEEVEVKLIINSKNDYEYLVFEDRKPAGCEAVDLKSGYIYQNGVYLNRELRDEKVVFFLNNLPQGTQVLTYRLKAEIPGTFHALPHFAQAMYAPQIKGISDEAIIEIRDQ